MRVGSSCARPSVDQLIQNAIAGCRALFGDFVADAPDDHPGMVAVAADCGAHVLLVPVGKEQVVVVRRFCRSQQSNDSSMTRKPMRSHKSSNSGAGGLWLVRMALLPISLQDLELALPPRAVERRARARRDRDDRTRRWMRTRSPLSKKPVVGVNSIVRMPKVVSSGQRPGRLARRVVTAT